MKNKFKNVISIVLSITIIFSIGTVSFANNNLVSSISNSNLINDDLFISNDVLFSEYINFFDELEDGSLKMNINFYSGLSESDKIKLEYTIDKYNEIIVSFNNYIDDDILFSKYIDFFDKLDDNTLKLNSNAYNNLSDFDRDNLTLAINIYNEKLNIEKYIDINDSGAPVFNENLAMINGESDDFLDFGSEFNDFSKQMQPTKNKRALIIGYKGIYGRWCGIFWGSGTPINLVDRGCMVHDRCYGSKGYFKCSCDRDAAKYMYTVSKYLAPGKEKNMALLIGNYFSFSACK